MKETFERFYSEIKVLEKNLDFLEENGTKLHLPILDEICKTLNDLEVEFNNELLKLAICKNSYFFIESYREHEFDLDFLNERVAILKHIEKMKQNSKLLNKTKLPDSNNELMVSKIGKRVFPKIEELKDKCCDLRQVLKRVDE